MDARRSSRAEEHHQHRWRTSSACSASPGPERSHRELDGLQAAHRRSVDRHCARRLVAQDHGDRARRSPAEETINTSPASECRAWREVGGRAAVSMRRATDPDGSGPRPRSAFAMRDEGEVTAGRANSMASNSTGQVKHAEDEVARGDFVAQDHGDRLAAEGNHQHDGGAGSTASRPRRRVARCRSPVSPVSRTRWQRVLTGRPQHRRAGRREVLVAQDHGWIEGDAELKNTINTMAAAATRRERTHRDGQQPTVRGT